MKEYWKFYWPLAITGVAMVIVVQFQNGALARYPQAATEIAIFALSYSTFSLFRAALNFVSQLVNVFGRSNVGIVRTRKFVLVVSVVCATVLFALGISPIGSYLVEHIYAVDLNIVARVQEYFIYLAPLIVFDAQRFFLTGLLVQAKLTGWVTTLNIIGLVVTIFSLVIGFSLELRPVHVLVGAELVSAAVQLTLLTWVKRTRYALPENQEHQHLQYSELARFFAPVATTGLMFALSRPVLYAMVARLEEGVLYIAAMRVAFDFAMMFQQAANQFRHFFVTFGLDDLARKRRFLVLVAAGITLLMCLFTFSPLIGWIWSGPMNIPNELIEPATQVLMVMCILPVIILWRNYYHGILMVERRTGSMATASILRVIGIYVMVYVATIVGVLDHITAAWALIGGFVIETLVVRRAGELTRVARPVR